jgi:hypothetical protein
VVQTVLTIPTVLTQKRVLCCGSAGGKTGQASDEKAIREKGRTFCTRTEQH